MSNPYFQFKQFIVHQDACAMKVCTDSCLFGAWVTKWLVENKEDLVNILDIGTGTGLLSMLLAQKLHCINIDAVEISRLSVQQARENFLQSPWKERLCIYESRIQDFNAEKKYDFVICNPPFYQDDLVIKNSEKNAAHHHTELTFGELITAINRLLSNTGNFGVLLPYHRTAAFEKLANESGFFLYKKTLLKQTDQHHYFRSMNLFLKEKSICEQEEITIKDAYNYYTSQFIHLLKDYYLYL
jgi:tRNA1Val (adenine37-N6)-methyltransferase